jgi:hypothetical protein
MRRCPNLGCPFRIRHGFAAEFEDRVARCPRCDAELTALTEPQAEPGSSAVIAPALGRGAVSLVLLLGLLAFARVPVPGYADLATLPFDISFAAASLKGALAAWIVASIAVELVALLLPHSLRHSLAGREKLRATSMVLALIGLAWGAWLIHGRVHAFADPFMSVELPGLGRMILTSAAGLAVILGLAAVNERWGLGNGISLIVGALVLHSLTITPTDDPIAKHALTVLLIGGLAIWLSRPARAGVVGRAPGSDTDLGLGLTVPSCSLVPLFVLPVVPLLMHILGLPARLPNTYAPVILALSLVVVVALAVALAWWFTRPRLLVALWRRAFPRADEAALEQAAQTLFRRALTRSVLLVVALVLLGREGLAAIEAAVLAALLVDFSAEFRFRQHPDLVALEFPGDGPSAEALAYALRLEDRPVLVQGLGHRALYHLFGTWLPLRLLVRETDRARAEQLRDELLRNQ